jgi:4-aminobutyrate aminotransferase-like enzyme
MKFNRVLVEQEETFWFQNYDVVPDIVVMGKEWVAECQLALLQLHQHKWFVE